MKTAYTEENFLDEWITREGVEGNRGPRAPSKRPTERESPASLEEALLRPRHAIVVVLDNIRSLYNVGAIFRVSDGAWIQKLYLGGITGRPPNPAIEKTALGATRSVPWEHVADPVPLVGRLKADGYTVVALERTDRSLLYDEFPPSAFPACLLMGNEVAGLSHALLDLVDLAVEVPQFGYKKSLNVATAYAVAIYGLVQISRRSRGLSG
ncbi:MAG: RNA methyltransferase [Thermoplasmata archaeon]